MHAKPGLRGLEMDDRWFRLGDHCRFSAWLMKKHWLRFTLLEVLITTVVFSVGAFLNFVPRKAGGYRIYGWPFSAVEFMVYPKADYLHDPEFVAQAYETQSGYWMQIQSVDTPFCIGFNFLLFLGISMLLIFTTRKLFSRSKTNPNIA